VWGGRSHSLALNEERSPSRPGEKKARGKSERGGESYFYTERWEREPCGSGGEGDEEGGNRESVSRYGK